MVKVNNPAIIDITLPNVYHSRQSIHKHTHTHSLTHMNDGSVHVPFTINRVSYEGECYMSEERGIKEFYSPSKCAMVSTTPTHTHTHTPTHTHPHRHPHTHTPTHTLT